MKAKLSAFSAQLSARSGTGFQPVVFKGGTQARGLCHRALLIVEC